MKIRNVQTLAILVCLASQPLASAAELQATVYDSIGNPLSDAVVVAFPEDGQIPPAKRGATVEDQIDKEFVPNVLLVRVGSYVNFPNKDNIRHHVYSFSAGQAVRAAAVQRHADSTGAFRQGGRGLARMQYP